MTKESPLLSLLLEAIEEISNSEFQDRVWVQGIGPECSSFDEAICGFFDDAQAGYILEYPDKFGLTTEQANVLREFFIVLSSFSDKTPENTPAAEIVKDPRWQTIKEKAEQALIILRKS